MENTLMELPVPHVKTHNVKFAEDLEKLVRIVEYTE
jgi:hypothetical protein